MRIISDFFKGDDDLTDIWNDYQQCRDYLRSKNFFSRSELCRDFVQGEQWRGLKVPSGMERPPQLNVLKPIMKNAISLVCQNKVEMFFSPLNKTNDKEKYIYMCEALNKFSADTWERLKFDSKMWQVLKDAYTVGDSYYYFFWEDDEIKAELLDNTNIFLGDENNPNIQEQPFILIPQRKYVKTVKEEAAANKIDKEKIEEIVPDECTDEIMSAEDELKNGLKVTVVTKLWKEKGVVYISRATRNVVYQEPTALSTKDGAVTLYPIANYCWNLQKHSARGLGDIYDKIPNQIEINKGIYRFCQAVKCSAFPHKIFLKSVLNANEVKNLDIPGSSISIESGNIQNVNNAVSYLQPGNISSYAATIWQVLIEQTRELAGAGDNLENINPEQASGSAINAAREAKALNVNDQVSAYMQFIEDVALIWADMWKAYNTDTFKINRDNTEINIASTEFSKLKPSVRVDITPSTPYSKMSQEIELKELLAAKHITFEEYLYCLSDNSNVPKAKLQEVLEKRIQLQEETDDEMSAMSNGNVQGQFENIGNTPGIGGQNGLQMPEQAMF